LPNEPPYLTRSLKLDITTNEHILRTADLSKLCNQNEALHTWVQYTTKQDLCQGAAAYPLDRKTRTCVQAEACCRGGQEPAARDLTAAACVFTCPAQENTTMSFWTPHALFVFACGRPESHFPESHCRARLRNVSVQCLVLPARSAGQDAGYNPLFR